MRVLLYACKTWTLRKRDKDSLLAFEMRCYKRILHIRWQQKITNVQIRRRLEIKINVVQLIMEEKLKLFGHISRMDGNRLVKFVVLGMMNGKTSEEDQAGNDIKEWCQTDIHMHSPQHGAGLITMATDCQRSIGHQRARAHGMKKKKK